MVWIFPPSCTSDLPHPKMVIEDSMSGILAAPEEPNTFVDAICKLVDNRELGYQMGQAGSKAFREKYSWESQVPKLVIFYNTLLGKSH